MILVLIFTSCTYQLYKEIPQETTKKYENKKYVLLRSYDPFGLITKTLCTELYKNKIKILDILNNNLDAKNMYIYLHIINTSENHITTSVFSNGTEAEYQLVLHINAKLSIINVNKKNSFPINIQVHRAFIKNFNYPLSNDVQEKNIRQLMYQEVAEKIVFYINAQYENYF